MLNAEHPTSPMSLVLAGLLEGGGQTCGCPRPQLRQHPSHLYLNPSRLQDANFSAARGALPLSHHGPHCSPLQVRRHHQPRSADGRLIQSEHYRFACTARAAHRHPRLHHLPVHAILCQTPRSPAHRHCRLDPLARLHPFAPARPSPLLVVDCPCRCCWQWCRLCLAPTGRRTSG